MSWTKPSEAFHKFTDSAFEIFERVPERLINSNNRITDISGEVRKSVWGVLSSPFEFVAKSTLLFAKKIGGVVGKGVINTPVIPVK